MIKFTPGNTPIVQKGNMSIFIILTENTTGPAVGQKSVFPAYYLNGFPLEHYDGCACKRCSDDDYDGEGHPATGWYSERSDFEFDGIYECLDCKVLAHAKLPNVIDVLRILQPRAQHPNIGANKNPSRPEGLIPSSPPPPAPKKSTEGQ